MTSGMNFPRTTISSTSFSAAGGVPLCEAGACAQPSPGVSRAVVPSNSAVSGRESLVISGSPLEFDGREAGGTRSPARLAQQVLPAVRPQVQPWNQVSFASRTAPM